MSKRRFHDERYNFSRWFRNKTLAHHTSNIKAAMPIYDKPMIYYLRSQHSCKRGFVTFSSSPHPKIKVNLSDYSVTVLSGELISNMLFNCPDGLAQAFIIGEEFIGDDKVAIRKLETIFSAAAMNLTIRFSLAPTLMVVLFLRVWSRWPRALWCGWVRW